MSTASTENILISGTRYSIPPYFKGCSEQTTWDALGDAMISKLVEEEVSGVNEVDYQDSTGSSRRRKRGRASTWEFVHEKHSVMVFKKKLTDSRLCFMGRGIIDKPLAEVAEFIKQVENNMTWDCFLIEAKYLQVIHESPLSAAYVGYQRYETKKCMMSTKRDMLYYARCSHQGDRYIQAGLSIKSLDFPCPSGVKRIEVGPGSGWIMEKLHGNDSRTLVTYVANVDLKGLPIFVMNMVLKRHPLAVHFVRGQMINPSARPRCPSSATQSSDDNEEDWSAYQSMDLPDDFVPNADHNSSSEECGTSFEQSMPMEHFTKYS